MADDDNGNLDDGTPHMSAIFAAFDRHGIACATPGAGLRRRLRADGGHRVHGHPRQRAGPALLEPVAGATRYRVFRSEGHAGCSFGKALVAEVTGTAHTDTAVANDRAYAHNVVAVGASSSCSGPAGACLTVTPAGTAALTSACLQPGLGVRVAGRQRRHHLHRHLLRRLRGLGGPACASVPAGVTCSYATNPVTPPAEGSASSVLTLSVDSSTPTGTYLLQAQGTSGTSRARPTSA